MLVVVQLNNICKSDLENQETNKQTINQLYYVVSRSNCDWLSILIFPANSKLVGKEWVCSIPCCGVTSSSKDVLVKEVPGRFLVKK